MKRILYITLVVLAVIPAACKQICPEPEPEPIGREEFPGNVIYYTTVDDQPILLPDIKAFSSDYVATYYQDGQGVLLFADNIETINAGAFNKNDKLKTIDLSPYIKTIGDDAFSDCKNLEKVSFSRWCNLETIGKNAFKNNTRLSGFTFPASLKSVGDYAFSGCNIQEFNYTGKNIKLGTGALKDCKNLATVNFNEGEAEIGDNCFDGCEALSKVDLPTKSPRIGSYAFKGCSSLKELHANFDGDLPAVGTDVFENGTYLFVRVDYDRFEDYKAAWGNNANHLMVGNGYEKIDASRWTDYIPDCMPLSLLTVPGLHDAATYSASYNIPIESPIKKDQDLDYREAWKLGARLFDLRLGFNNRPGGGSFDECCCFYHGDFDDILCKLNTFDEDINNHFPKFDDVKKSFMILIAKFENDPDNDYHNHLNVFEYFMRVMLGVYPSDVFISYNPSLTLGDLKGKILLLVREEEFHEDYSKIGGLPLVPVNYLNWEHDGGYVAPYINAVETGDQFQLVVQDKYEVNNAEEKYNAIVNVLNEPVPELLINGFNAILSTYESWDVSSHVNRKVVVDMNAKKSAYIRPMGLVLYDFCGVEKYHDLENWSDYDFAGESLQKNLVRQNFWERY